MTHRRARMPTLLSPVTGGTSIKIFFGGGAKGEEKMLGGKNMKKEKLCSKCTKTCYFYAEIVKFGQILTRNFVIIITSKFG